MAVPSATSNDTENAALFSLPPELIQRILLFLSAEDVSCVSQSCLAGWAHTNNNILWKKLFQRRKFFVPSSPQESQRENASLVKAAQSPLCERQQSCAWRDAFLRSSRLSTAWQKGCYVVQPPLRIHKQRITCMTCDGTHLASGCAAGLLSVWRLVKLEHQCAVKAFAVPVVGLSLQKNTGSLLAVSTAGAILTCAVSGGEQLRLGQVPTDGSSVETVAFSDVVLVCGLSSGVIVLCFSGAEDTALTFKAHDDEVKALQVDGALLFSTSWDKHLNVWLCQDFNIPPDCLLSLAFAEDIDCFQYHDQYHDGRLVLGTSEGCVSVWSMSPEHRFSHVSEFHHSAEVYCVAFNQECVVGGFSDGQIIIWDFDTGTLRYLSDHIGIVRCLQLDGRRLISGGDSRQVRVWDIETGNGPCRLHRHPTLLYKMWADETRLVTVSPDWPGTITVLRYD